MRRLSVRLDCLDFFEKPHTVYDLFKSGVANSKYYSNCHRIVRRLKENGLIQGNAKPTKAFGIRYKISYQLTAKGRKLLELFNEGEA